MHSFCKVNQCLWVLERDVSAGGSGGLLRVDGEEGIGVGTGFAGREFTVFDGCVVGGEEGKKVLLGPGGREMADGQLASWSLRRRMVWEGLGWQSHGHRNKRGDKNRPWKMRLPSIIIRSANPKTCTCYPCCPIKYPYTPIALWQ